MYRAGRTRKASGYLHKPDDKKCIAGTSANFHTDLQTQPNSKAACRTHSAPGRFVTAGSNDFYVIIELSSSHVANIQRLKYFEKLLTEKSTL